MNVFYSVGGEVAVNFRTVWKSQCVSVRELIVLVRYNAWYTHGKTTPIFDGARRSIDSLGYNNLGRPTLYNWSG